jgi:glycosyltransferase involved in cell wall biosynthesis
MLIWKKEMSMCKVSVIVPVYRVEKYIHRCVDSILAQSFGDFELILVDDGSPDNCGSICDEYAEKDTRIVVIHQKNAGVSAARNAGLDIASGEYITFCDSDDYWGTNRLQNMVDAAQLENADVIVTDYTAIDSNGITIGRSDHTIMNLACSAVKERYEYCIKTVLGGAQGCEIWTRLFNASIIRDHNIRFCLTCGNYAEDMGFVLEFSLFAKKIYSIPSFDYYYVVRDGSMMQSSMKVVKLNQLNEVSAFIGPRFLKQSGKIVFHRYYPILHFLMMHTEYRKCVRKDSYNSLSYEIAKIANQRWFRKQNKNIFFTWRTLRSFYSDRVSKQILLLSAYCLHGNWKRFSYESAIAYRFFIKEE